MRDQVARPPAVPHVPGRQWTTREAPAREQFHLWQEAVDQAFVPVTVRRASSGVFASEVATRRLGAVELADIAAAPQSVSRTADQIRRSAGDVFFLNLPLTNGASVVQSGRTARLRANDFVVVDGDRPFELHFSRPFRQVSLSIPREALEARLLATGDVLGLQTAGDRALGAVAGAAIRAAADTASSLDPRSATALGEQLVELVALALGGVRPQPASASRALLLRATLGEVERRLSDPTLSPAAVAGRVGISVRYLHRLFADHGPSFGQWVLQRRLDRAQRLLADPGHHVLTVGEIALGCGFTDPSYFARAFKAHHGLTPTQLRRSTTR